MNDESTSTKGEKPAVDTDEAVVTAEPVTTPTQPQTETPTTASLVRTFDHHSPFYFGFFFGLGALVAFFLFTAVTGISSVLMLVVVSLFLACGLNPSVEFLERRGLRRPWAVFVVIICVFVGLALFLVAIVPVITDQVRALTDNVPGWLDELQQNQQIQKIDDEYDIIDEAAGLRRRTATSSAACSAAYSASACASSRRCSTRSSSSC